MMERRNSDRVLMPKLMIRETNGDYFFTLRAVNLSEEGLFLENKFCGPSHEAFSKLSFTLPNGKMIHNVTARIVREDKTSEKRGCAYEFLKISEHDRMELKKFFHERLLKGTA